MIKTSLFIATPGMPEVKYVHLFTDDVAKNVARAASLGFDGVELLIDDPDTFDADKLDTALTQNRIQLAAINTGRMVFQFGCTLVHPDEKIRALAFKKFQSIVKIAGRFKCGMNIGLFRGRAIEDMPIAYTRDMFVEIMKDACDFAKQFGVNLNFEPTNRFETNFIHTTDEGLEIIERVQRPNLGLLLDLYHMYIEDRDIMDSIVKARDHVRHFHFSDSDRWPAGLGHGVFDFKALVRLLKLIGYDGYLSEGLVPTDNVDECARKTAAYLRTLINGD